MQLMVNHLLLYLFPAFSSLFIGEQDPGLIFREDWKEIPAAIPVTAEHLSNANLELHLYGVAEEQLKKSNHPEIPNDPFYIWSGTCEGNWAMAFSLKDASSMDLRENGKVIWKSRQSGFRELHLILQLEDDSWLVSQEGVAESPDWEQSTFIPEKMTWRKLSMDGITEGAKVENPDLSGIQKIGITDLMRGGGTPASSRLDWMEVYGTVRH